MRSCAFVVGDWLVYSEDRFGAQLALPGIDPGPSTAVSRDQYDAARVATGIDPAILANYAYVARNVSHEIRREGGKRGHEWR